MSRQSKVQNRVVKETTAGCRRVRELSLLRGQAIGPEASTLVTMVTRMVTGLALLASFAALVNLLRVL